MGRFSKTYPTLFQGVSQQSPELRIDGQCQESINCKLTIVRGLEKRPSSDLISTDRNSPLGTSVKIHKIDRDSTERYLQVLDEDGLITVYDTSGNIYPVIFENTDAEDYVSAQDADGILDPLRDLRLATVADYTILVNKNVLPAMDADLTAVQELSALVWVKVSSANQKTVIVDGTSYNNSTTSTQGSALALKNLVDAVSGITATMVNTPSSVFTVKKDDLSDFTIGADDAGGGTYLRIAKTDGAEKSNIPSIAPNGTVVKIESEDNLDASYYLKYNSSKGAWRETIGPEEKYKFDAKTMPHQITREQDDVSGTITGTPNQIYFKVNQVEWVDKAVGDSESAPNPSFIGRPIEDVFFFKSRLGFLAGESVIMSRTAEFFDFFPTTALEVVDDDPIDIDTSVSIDSVVTLKYGIPTPDAITLFGSNQQFSMHSGDKRFTPENVIIDTTTSYACNGNVSPILLGSSVYFASPREVYTSVREYAIQADTLISDASDLTGHVPRYVPRELSQLIGSTNLEWAFCIPKDEAGVVYVYKYFWRGDEKAQSSWSKWEFPWLDIKGGATFDGSLYLIGSEDEGANTALLKIDLENSFEEPTNTDLRDITTHLDRLEFPATIFTDVDGNLKILLGTFPLINEVADQISDVLLVDRETGIAYTLESADGNVLTFTVDTEHPIPTGLEILVFMDTQSLNLGFYTLGGTYIEQ